MSKDGWGDGAAYQRYMGRWSLAVAEVFLEWFAAPTGLRWLDVGCGSGNLSRMILAKTNPAQVIGIDSAPGFVAYAQSSVSDLRARFFVGDAQSIHIHNASVDAAVSGLVLNFVPEPSKAIGEMARVTRAGGWIGGFVWDYADGMQFMRVFWEAAVELDPSASLHDEGQLFDICRPGAIENAFRKAGLNPVAATELIVDTVFESFDDFWVPFLGGVGPGSRYVLSLEKLPRTRLKEKLREKLPFAPDGSIPLTARAWAAKGQVPAR